MKGIPIQEAVLVENIRIGGTQDKAFTTGQSKHGWRKAEYMAWVPELNALLIGLKHKLIPDETVIVVPAANVASMHTCEDDLDQIFYEPEPKAEAKRGK